MAYKPTPKKRKLLFITGLLILILGVGLITWKLLVKERPSDEVQTTAQSSSDNQSTSLPSSGTDVPDATATKEYENGYLALKLDYPDTWKVSESENKDGVRIESPQFNYQSLDKGQVNGTFRIYIRKGARESESKYIGRGVAIGDSVKLVYTKPTQSQRTETNLSQFGLDNPNNFAFFLIAGNFSLKKGDVLGPSYGKEFDTYIIAGGYSADDLTDDLATHTVSNETFYNTNAYKQAVDILKSIQIR